MKGSSNTINLMKLITFSGLGIFSFFVPFFPKGNSRQTFIVYSVNLVKAYLANVLPIIVLLAIFSLIILCIIAKKSDNFPTIKKLYGSVKAYSIVLYCIGGIFATMIYLNVGPASLLAKGIGGLGMGLAKTVIVTIIIAGILVPLIAEFGLLELIGSIIEPLMRPLFKVPGYASIDAVTSFVANPTVGIFFTNKLYVNKMYTTREACSIATNFSFISLGFFAVMCQAANIMDYYGEVVLSSFLLSFVMAFIVIRIPPISFLPDTLIDGSARKEEERSSFSIDTIREGYATSLDKAGRKDLLPLFKKYLIDVTIFAQKITAYILCISIITLWLVDNTSLFHILGVPFAPILELLQIPNASEVAPTMILGLAEVALPATFISGMGVATETAFFVVVVSGIQIIMFSNSAVSIMESEIPLGIGKLIIIFFVRTIVAMPLVALLTHMLF